MVSSYEPALEEAIEAAFARLHETLNVAGPTVAERVLAWMDGMGGRACQKDAYKHPLSYPMLLLPWWAEKAVHDPPDAAFQADLVYSTVNGYYAIRLVDNLMDGHATIERDVLPALHVFGAEFQRTYQGYFGSDHPFWQLFTQTWFHSAEVTLKDAGAVEIDREHFVAVTARKTEAVKIPIAAVCHRYERPGLIEVWREIVDLFGCWHQMSNDLFDWRKDLELGTPTYFLSEAARRGEPGEAVIGWVARERFGWAMQTLDDWMEELKGKARVIESPDLGDYLTMRESMLRERAHELAPGLQSATGLFGLLRNTSDHEVPRRNRMHHEQTSSTTNKH